MKKILYFTAAVLLTLLPCGCYEDKGNYDYTDIGDLTVDVTSEIYRYQTTLGDTGVTIPMTVTGNVPEAELNYTWEMVVDGRRFEEFFEGKDFTCPIDPEHYFMTYGDYQLRLKVSRTIKGYTSEVYSPIITLTVGGESGLMVLHGDAAGCDIGVIQDPDFMIVANTSVAEKVSFDSYSRNNGGAKIPGKGVQVAQFHSSSMFGVTADNCNVYVITDQTSLYAAAAGFVKKGDYMDMFYSLPDHGPLAKSNPELFQFASSENRYVIDDGDLFCVNSQTARFSARSEFKDIDDYKFSKWSYIAGTSYLFDTYTRSFISAVTQGAPSELSNNRTYNSTAGAFNVGDVQADLLFLERVSQTNRYLAVFEDDSDVRFIGEINFGSTTEEYGYAKYGVSDLPQFGSAMFHAFGATNSNCYYATASDVYYYSVVYGSGTSEARKLAIGTSEIPFSGEITMMKILKPRMTGGNTYHRFDVMLVVATYENGIGTLHAITLDNMSGAALTHRKFTDFDRIYDVNLKSM